MKKLILMAMGMSASELAAEIKRFESGEKNLSVRDERGRRVPLSSLVLAILRRVQRDRLASANGVSENGKQT